jgi:hypothetical protein
MAIDPRWVSTPIGAAIGVVLAKKLLAKKDQTTANLAVGAGLGGGAGFLTGQFIKGTAGDLSTAKEPVSAYDKYVTSELPMGAAGPGELATVDRIKPVFGNVPATGGGMIQSARRNVLKAVGPEVVQLKSYRMRSHYLKKALESGSMSPQSRAAAEKALAWNQSAEREMKSRIKSRLYAGRGAKALLTPLWDMVTNLGVL